MSKFTKSIKASEIERQWVLVDAKDKIFGRLVTEIASILRGKHKPFFTPHVDCGDFVVVINASEAILSKKDNEEAKLYRKHTGYFGGLKEKTFVDLRKNNPEKLFKLATRGMLPKNKLGKEMLKKLKVYAQSEHPHSAQIKASK